MSITAATLGQSNQDLEGQQVRGLQLVPRPPIIPNGIRVKETDVAFVVRKPTHVQRRGQLFWGVPFPPNGETSTHAWIHHSLKTEYRNICTFQHLMHFLQLPSNTTLAIIDSTAVSYWLHDVSVRGTMQCELESTEIGKNRLLSIEYVILYLSRLAWLDRVRT